MTSGRASTQSVERFRRLYLGTPSARGGGSLVHTSRPRGESGVLRLEKGVRGLSDGAVLSRWPVRKPVATWRI